MRVRVIKQGYYLDQRRREGEEFDLVERKGFKKIKDGKVEPIVLSIESQFSENWMERLDGDAPSKDEDPKPKKKAKAKSKKKEEEAEAPKPDFGDEEEVI